MNKFIIYFVLLITFSIKIFSQTPQYYNLNTGSSVNIFPFNVPSGKAVNSLFLAGEFNQPSPIPSGQQITKVYFRTATTGTRTYTNLHILMAQDVITTLTSGQFYPGPWDTVYFKASTTLSSTVGGWMGISLDKPFAYDTSKSLIIFVGQCGYSGAGTSVYNTSLSGIRRVWSVGGCPFIPYANGDAYMINFGVDVVPSAPQHYNYNTAVGTNTFPFNQTAGKMVQWLAGPGEYIQPTPAPSGEITAVYFFMGGAGATGRMFTDFTIRMGRTALTTLPTGAFYTGPLDTVYHRSAVALTSASNSWMVIPLDNPFTYYNDSSLIIEVGQCGYTPTTGTMYICQTTLSGNHRSWSVGGCPFVYAGQGGQIAHTGIYIPTPVSTGNNNNRVPETYRLDQNYPNPFNPATIISFGLPKNSNAKLTVYDMLGREVRVLINDFRKAGNYSIEFDASNLSSGVYLYKLETDGFTASKKMTLIK